MLFTMPLFGTLVPVCTPKMSLSSLGKVAMPFCWYSLELRYSGLWLVLDLRFLPSLGHCLTVSQSSSLGSVPLDLDSRMGRSG